MFLAAYFTEEGKRESLSIRISVHTSWVLNSNILDSEIHEQDSQLGSILIETCTRLFRLDYALDANEQNDTHQINFPYGNVMC